MPTYLVSLNTGLSTRVIMVRASSKAEATFAASVKTGKVGWAATPLDHIRGIFMIELGLDDKDGRKALVALLDARVADEQDPS